MRLCLLMISEIRSLSFLKSLTFFQNCFVEFRLKSDILGFIFCKCALSAFFLVFRNSFYHQIIWFYFPPLGIFYGGLRCVSFRMIRPSSALYSEGNDTLY